MKLFVFQLEWDQAINYSFDQDDVKTVGNRRVTGECRIVAPDRELAELALWRGFKHAKAEVQSCVEQVIHQIVTYRAERYASVEAIKPVGPEHIDPHWQKAIDADRRHSW